MNTNENNVVEATVKPQNKTVKGLVISLFALMLAGGAYVVYDVSQPAGKSVVRQVVFQEKAQATENKDTANTQATENKEATNTQTTESNTNAGNSNTVAGTQTEKPAETATVDSGDPVIKGSVVEAHITKDKIAEIISGMGEKDTRTIEVDGYKIQIMYRGSHPEKFVPQRIIFIRNASTNIVKETYRIYTNEAGTVEEGRERIK